MAELKDPGSDYIVDVKEFCEENRGEGGGRRVQELIV